MIANQLAERRLADELRQQERQQFEGQRASASGAISSDSEAEGDSLMRKTAAGKKKAKARML
jgi:hypothetical protein